MGVSESSKEIAVHQNAWSFVANDGTLVAGHEVREKGICNGCGHRVDRVLELQFDAVGDTPAQRLTGKTAEALADFLAEAIRRQAAIGRWIPPKLTGL